MTKRARNATAVTRPNATITATTTQGQIGFCLRSRGRRGPAIWVSRVEIMPVGTVLEDRSPSSLSPNRSSSGVREVNEEPSPGSSLSRFRRGLGRGSGGALQLVFLPTTADNSAASSPAFWYRHLGFLASSLW